MKNQVLRLVSRRGCASLSPGKQLDVIGEALVMQPGIGTDGGHVSRCMCKRATSMSNNPPPLRGRREELKRRHITRACQAVQDLQLCHLEVFFSKLAGTPVVDAGGGGGGEPGGGNCGETGGGTSISVCSQPPPR